MSTAALSPEIMLFMKALLCCPVVEGYGQTEVGGGATYNHPEDPHGIGTVGNVLLPLEMKLVSVPDMNYHAQ